MKHKHMKNHPSYHCEVDDYFERMRLENPKSLEVIKLACDYKVPEEEIIYTGNTLIRVVDYSGVTHYETRVSNEYAETKIEEVKKKWNLK